MNTTYRIHDTYSDSYYYSNGAHGMRAVGKELAQTFTSRTIANAHLNKARRLARECLVEAKFTLEVKFS